jgi:transcriptional regulator with XRE-family HTH domain
MLPSWWRTPDAVVRYVSDMVTRIGGRRRAHLYIKEWMDHRGLSDETLGNRLGVARQTVYRRRIEQHRLTPDKIAEFASALDCEPEDLWRPPSRPSIDAVTSDLPDEIHGDVLEFAERLRKRAT